MTNITLLIRSTDDLPDAARQLLQLADVCRIFLFTAEMGAGKTTLIKSLCKELGSEDHFSSPTYSLINQYISPKGKIYHLDLYRVEGKDELYDLGVEEILDSGNYCFVEWPEKMLDMIESDYVAVEIKVLGTERYLSARRISQS